MTAPRLALTPRPDLPARGAILTLATPTGERFYRIARATGERVVLLPLSEEDRGAVLAVLRARAVQQGLVVFWEVVSAWARQPRWRRAVWRLPWMVVQGVNRCRFKIVRPRCERDERR